MAGGGLAREMGERGGEPGVYTGDRAPIGLVGAARCVVAARVGQIGDGLVDRGMLARNRQFGAERVDRVEIETEHRLARAAERGAQRIGGDEGVAVAIAADPASRLEEVRAALAERPGDRKRTRLNSRP